MYALSRLDGLRPLGLTDVLGPATALQDRLDVKYLLPWTRLEELIDSLAPTHGVLEIDGRRSFTYRTTYFDTPDLRTYRDHVQRRRRRFKCRTREYLETGLCTFEVKLRSTRGRTVKQRRPVGEGWSGCSGFPLDFLSECLARGYGRALDTELGPTLTMEYSHITLAAPERGERLTCDYDLVFVAPDGRRGRLAPEHLILESKSDTGRALADHVLRRMGARPVNGCSKYCVGIGLTRPHVSSNPFRPLLRRYFEPV